MLQKKSSSWVSTRTNSVNFSENASPDRQETVITNADGVPGEEGLEQFGALFSCPHFVAEWGVK
jgi:hypothetical protein